MERKSFLRIGVLLLVLIILPLIVNGWTCGPTSQGYSGYCDCFADGSNIGGTARSDRVVWPSAINQKCTYFGVTAGSAKCLLALPSAVQSAAKTYFGLTTLCGYGLGCDTPDVGEGPPSYLCTNRTYNAACGYIGYPSICCQPGSIGTQSCGNWNTGTQSRTCSSDGAGWGDWGPCLNQGVCTPGSAETRNCSVGIGIQSRICNSSYQWGSWTGNCTQPVCTPGAVENRNCPVGVGTQSRTCNSSHQWGSWVGYCNTDICVSGQIQTVACDNGSSKSRTCQSNGQWGVFGDCTGGAVTLVPEVNNICLPRKDSYGIELKLGNDSGERKCYDFEAETEPYLDATLSPNETVCVNNHETRTMTLSINTWDADEDDYNISVFAEGDSSLSLHFDVRVGDCEDGNFDLTWNSRNLCRGEKETVRATVENNSNFSRVVKLYAENEMMLPYFSRETVTVPANGEKEVDLILNARFAPLGKKTIFLRATSGNVHIEKSWDTEVVDCSGITRKTFFVEAPFGCFDVQKGNDFSSRFAVRKTSENCSERQQLFFYLTGMGNVLSANAAWFGCGESKTIDFKISVPVDAEAGKQYLVAKATDGTFSDEKQICINVVGASNAELLLKEDSKNVVKGFSGIFELEARNTGDFNETFSLELLEIPSQVSAVLSETNFSLLRGNSKAIYLTITPSDSVFLGLHKLKVKLKTPVAKIIEVHFNVVERASLQELEILSYSQELSLESFGSARYELILRNNSAGTLRDINISFENVPRDININGALISELPSGRLADAAGIVKAGDINGSFEVNVVAKTGNLIVRKKILLSIKPVERIEQVVQDQNRDTWQNPLAGLFTLSFLGDNAGPFAGVFIILLLILIIILGIALFLDTQVYAQQEIFMLAFEEPSANAKRNNSNSGRNQPWVDNTN